MVKLRLKRMGSIDKPFYRIVSLDSRKKRDGIYLESIGYYDPKTDPSTFKVDTERAIYWLSQGAQPSETVRSLLKKAGILQKWHEMKFAAKAEIATEAELKPKTKSKKELAKSSETIAEETIENAESETELTEIAAETKVEEPPAESQTEDAETVETKQVDPEEEEKE